MTSSWLEAIGVRMIPANFGPMKAHQAYAKYMGPCGDTMEFWLQVSKDTIVRASFTTDGCESSVACGSVAAHLVQGRTVEEVLTLDPSEIRKVVGMPEDHAEGHCALLATRTLCRALLEYQQAHSQSESECGGCSEDCCDGCGGGKKDTGESTHTDGCSGKKDAAGASAPIGGMDQVKRRILVLSGKGGVGKSTVATHLAMAFAGRGTSTGLLDVDLHGPSIPKMLGLESAGLDSEGGRLIPVEMGPLKVMSMGFALEADQAAIWRGPMKASVVDQLINRTAWEGTEVLVVDCPPGTGDEVISLAQGLGRVDGAVIVTTPQEVATLDAQKAITFCRTMEIPVLGVVENMSGLSCPSCGTSIPVFSEHGGQNMASNFSIPFLGRIPLDPQVVSSADRGMISLSESTATGRAFQSIFDRLQSALEGQPVA